MLKCQFKGDVGNTMQEILPILTKYKQIYVLNLKNVFRLFIVYG